MNWFPIVGGTIASLIGTAIFVPLMQVVTKKRARPTNEKLKRENDALGAVMFFSVTWVSMVFPRLEPNSFVSEWFVVIHAAILCLVYFLFRAALKFANRKKAFLQDSVS